MSKRFGLRAFLVRLGVALVLVLATYNPEGLSYFHWLKMPVSEGAGKSWSDSTALKFLTGAILVTAWTVFLRATWQSLGLGGVGLMLSILAGLIWLAAELDWFSPDDTAVLTYLVLGVVAIVLATGMSWSHLRRRLTGQVDTDELE